MPRFTVIQNPGGRCRKGGYAIHDASPPDKTGDDIEGVGWVPARAGTKHESVIYWFRYRYVAEAHCEAKNMTNDRFASATKDMILGWEFKATRNRRKKI